MTMIQDFKNKIWRFYDTNKRQFPWRETQNPYKILVSEVMLQQTQTSRVVDKFNAFIAAFPTVKDLADAEFSQVLTYWSGLGFNRRAKFLHESAKIITLEWQGQIPDDPEKLATLPGIGINTACAICVYSFNSPHTFIETNIRRIFIHEFFSDREHISDQELLPLVEQTLDRKHPREWYWALMDYGSHLPKVVTNPNRKSKHYTKQSKFEGSVRQIRGEILRILLSGSKTEEELRREVKKLDARFSIALHQLQKEKLIHKTNQEFHL